MNYDLENERVIKEIKKNKAKTVLLQLPDGLKSRALEITDMIRKETKAEALIWLGTNYGACDIPKVKADLIIHYGHTKFI